MLQGNVDLTDLMRDDTQQTLTLTVMEGPPQVKTRQDVSNMSLDEFAMLTAVGFRILAFSTELFPHVYRQAQCASPLGVSQINTKGIVVPFLSQLSCLSLWCNAACWLPCW